MSANNVAEVFKNDEWHMTCKGRRKRAVYYMRDGGRWYRAEGEGTWAVIEPHVVPIDVLRVAYFYKTVPWEGDRWNIINLGAIRDDEIYLHLASTTKGRKQANGWMPNQVGVWYDIDLLHATV